MKLFFVGLLVVANNLFGQQVIKLHQGIANPHAFAEFEIISSPLKPLPINPYPMQIGDSLFTYRYSQQTFLLTDTTKANPIWFKLLLAFDGKDFWMAADTDYDSTFIDEIPIKVTRPILPDQIAIGKIFTGEIVQFTLARYAIDEHRYQPSFSIFTQPQFTFLTAQRGLDSLAINTAIIAGYKATSNINIGNDSLLIALQLHPFMPQFSLYEYYNVKHQQRSVINILSKDTSSDNKLIAYINAFDFLVKRKPWNIEEKEVTIFPKEIDYQQSRLSISQEPMKQTNAEMSISNCNNLIATSIKTNLPFSFSGPDSLILYFTGSWCAPCRELTPQVEKYFENLPKGWKGMVIANEKSLSAAKAYLNKFSFQNTFFEHLDDKTACSLKKIFSVGVYPTLVYINPTGRVLWIGQNIRN